MWHRLRKHHQHCHHHAHQHVEGETSLASCKPGQNVTVKGITGHCHARRRLETMGFLPGAKVNVVRADTNGPLVIRVKDSQFAIGRGMSHHILVA